jgi:hypothetical protein
MSKSNAKERSPDIATDQPTKAASTSENNWNVERCINWLKDQGFDVLYAQRGKRLPRIAIRVSPLCDRLEGAVRMYERTEMGELRYWVAIRFDCEVRWLEESL